MAQQLNIQVGDKVAVFTYWAKRPRASTVSLVTPTGKIRVEGVDGLMTPKDSYDWQTKTTSWQAQTGRDMRSTNVYPWTEKHDQRLESEAQDAEYRGRLSDLQARVSRLSVGQRAAIDRALAALGGL